MAQARCYSVLLGARNTRAAGRRFLARDERLIREVTAQFFPNGFTILKSSGGWFDPDGRAFCAEESRQILVNTDQRRALRRWCLALARALGQKEVLLVDLGPTMSFRTGTAREPPPSANRRGRARVRGPARRSAGPA